MMQFPLIAENVDIADCLRSMDTVDPEIGQSILFFLVELSSLTLHRESRHANVKVTTCLEEYPWHRSTMRADMRVDTPRMPRVHTQTGIHTTPFQEHRAIALCSRSIVTITRVAEMAPNATRDTAGPTSSIPFPHSYRDTELFTNGTTQFPNFCDPTISSCDLQLQN